MKMEKELCCGNRNYHKLTNNINNDGKTFKNLHIKRPQEDNKYEYANDDSNIRNRVLRNYLLLHPIILFFLNAVGGGDCCCRF